LAVKSYEIGSAFERRVKKYFEDLGYFVIKSAGSKSPIDLVCLKLGNNTIIQCRTRGNLTEEEERKLSALGKRLGCTVKLAYKQDKELWFRNL